MTDLEVFRLSAMVCGWQTDFGDHGEVFILTQNDSSEVVLLEWNPFTNAEQRWQCVEKLLETYPITLGKEPSRLHWLGMPVVFDSKCPASEFPARALAELKRRNP